MRNRHYLLSWLCLLFVSCGGGGSTAVTPIPTSNTAATEEAEGLLPPTFTPEAVEFEQPTPVTPAPTHTPAPATAVPPTSTPPISLPTPDWPDPLPLLITAENNLLSLTSFSHERAITVNTPAFNQSEDISCIFQAPDQAFCDAYRETIPVAGDPSVRDFEFVQRGPQLWARSDSTAAWQELTPDNVNYQEAYTNQLILSPFVTDAFIFGESAIDDVPVYEVRLTLEPMAAVNALYSGDSFEDFLAEAQGGQASATVWIGQSDTLLRLLTIEIQFDSALGEVSLNGLGTVANFNETAVIPQP